MKKVYPYKKEGYFSILEAVDVDDAKQELLHRYDREVVFTEVKRELVDDLIKDTYFTPGQSCDFFINNLYMDKERMETIVTTILIPQNNLGVIYKINE